MTLALGIAAGAVVYAMWAGLTWRMLKPSQCTGRSQMFHGSCKGPFSFKHNQCKSREHGYWIGVAAAIWPITLPALVLYRAFRLTSGERKRLDP